MKSKACLQAPRKHSVYCLTMQSTWQENFKTWRKAFHAALTHYMSVRETDVVRVGILLDGVMSVGSEFCVIDTSR